MEWIAAADLAIVEVQLDARTELFGIDRFALRVHARMRKTV